MIYTTLNNLTMSLKKKQLLFIHGLCIREHSCVIDHLNFHEKSSESVPAVKDALTLQAEFLRETIQAVELAISQL